MVREIQLLSDLYLSIKLQQRSTRYCDKLPKIPLGSTSLSLRDIARHGDSGPPHLRCQPKHLFLGKRARLLINQLHQTHALLPNENIPVRVSHRCCILNLKLETRNLKLETALKPVA